MTGGRVPADGGYGTLVVASSMIRRFLGIHGVDAATAVLIRTDSVHGRWLRHPIGLIWLDASGTVIGSLRLAPGVTARCRHAEFALEVRDATHLPDPGAHVQLLAFSRDGGNSDHLRHPHREPR